MSKLTGPTAIPATQPTLDLNIPEYEVYGPVFRDHKLKSCSVKH